nr:lipopolysaccharide transport periplasmic protein LptA [Oceanococcus sp. HetDA_MAG_MS8]
MSPSLRATITGLMLLAASLGSTAVVAQDRPAFLDPNLAISVEADSAELSQERNVSVYRGNVRLERGPLVLTGDRLVINRDPETNRIRATLSGSPARADYQDPNAEGQPVVATARRIAYVTGQELLELEGAAQIQRGEDSLKGESVRYEIPLARIQAEGDADDRVRITIQAPNDTPTP